MTTIAFRDGILASDTAFCYGIMLTGVRKITRGEKCLAGAAGGAGYNLAFLKWVEGGFEGDPPKPEQTEDILDRGAVFFEDGWVEIHEPGGVIRVKPPYYAFGSGKCEAVGAMFAGASAETAVRAAIEHDPHTGGTVEVLSFK